MTNVLIIIGLIVIAGLAMFVYPQWRLRRAIPQVIRIFRDHNAIGIKNAKAAEELGLGPKGMIGQLFNRRDYKQYAVNTLIQVEIIQVTEDGKLFMSQEKLTEYGLDRPTPYYR